MPFLKEIAGDKVTRRAVRWLVDGIIPMAKLSILDGDPGQGKSFVTLDLTAAVTSGWEFTPRGRGGKRKPANVVLLGGEDDAGDTVVQRLEAMGADVARVRFVEAVMGTGATPLGEVERPFFLPTDVRILERLILDVKAELVVIDPVMAYLAPDVRTNSDQAIRHALNPLKLAAERTGAAILMVRHLNKSGGAKALYRGGGSIGIIGLTRSAIYIGENPEDADSKVFAPIKNNLGRMRKPWVFRLETNKQGVTRVHWMGETDVPVSRILDTAVEKLPVEIAAEFLAELLKGGKKISASEGVQKAKAAGISMKTLVRARKAIKAVVLREHGEYFWSLGGQKPADVLDSIKGRFSHGQ